MNKYIVGILAVLILGGGLYLVRGMGGSQNQINTPNDSLSSTTDGTNSSSTPGDTPQTGSIKLKIGESGRADGVTIKPIQVVEDSRCPAGVYCIQAGTLMLKVQIVSGLGTSTPTLEIGKPLTTEAEIVTLTSVNPLRTASGTIKPSDYQFTFTVTSRSEIQAS